MTKTISFAIMHFSVAFAVAWALTGDIVIGGAVALVEPMVNTVAYHFHEKFWKRMEQRPRHSMSGSQPAGGGDFQVAH